jgi:hypothetical protein
MTVISSGIRERNSLEDIFKVIDKLQKVAKAYSNQEYQYKVKHKILVGENKFFIDYLIYR